MQRHTSFSPEEPSSLTYQVKFVRRADLSPETRHKIATIALHFAPKGRGVIPRLAARYNVSRQFVYGLRDRLSVAVAGAFAPPEAEAAPDSRTKRLLAVSMLLQLRLVGRCSLGAVSQLLHFFGACYGSVGFVSGTLKRLGAALPCMVDWSGGVIYASDELFFLGKRPILVTADPHSGAILRMEALATLTKEAWVRHWESLRGRGILPLGLTADEGWSLRAARMEVMAGVPWQPDTFHAIAHRLGVIGRRLRRMAETAIKEEYGREALLRDAERDGRGGTIAKQRQPAARAANQARKFAAQHATAREESGRATSTADGFHFLYRCMLAQLNPFDQNGLPRPRQKAEGEVGAAIELMRELNVTGLGKELDDLQKVLPCLFNFLDKAAEVGQQLAPITGTLELPFWAAAWTSLKKAHKSTVYAAQEMHRHRAESLLEMLEGHYADQGEGFAQRRELVFAHLDTIVQSSAVVENINSSLRPFLDQARDQVSQETINLIMFYHNHKVFKRGKRKGMAPIEILTGNKLEKHWHEMLMDIAAKL